MVGTSACFCRISFQKLANEYEVKERGQQLFCFKEGDGL